MHGLLLWWILTACGQCMFHFNGKEHLNVLLNFFCVSQKQESHIGLGWLWFHFWVNFFFSIHSLGELFLEVKDISIDKWDPRATLNMQTKAALPIRPFATPQTPHDSAQISRLLSSKAMLQLSSLPQSEMVWHGSASLLKSRSFAF